MILVAASFALALRYADLCGCVKAEHEQNWLQYATSFLVFHALSIIALYTLLRLQFSLPFNPQSLPALSPDLALNTAVSFVTNTSWQSYAGEIGRAHV